MNLRASAMQLYNKLVSQTSIYAPQFAATRHIQHRQFLRRLEVLLLERAPSPYSAAIEKSLNERLFFQRDLLNTT